MIMIIIIIITHSHDDNNSEVDPGGGLLRPRARMITWARAVRVGRGDDTVGNPHRAQIAQFELFEFILVLKLGKQFPVEQFEAPLI